MFCFILFIYSFILLDIYISFLLFVLLLAVVVFLLLVHQRDDAPRGVAWR